ncbi:hypothetical protein G8V07_14675 [Clostridium botulinum D/C]|uniref:hypothetical protein n=1 Tax=Clostridium botulinum TaxID=1491 RepID=UPI001E606AB9|nr:hypothetical protein [Clostridium botulinum]MCD3321687.1 hypothetical protein [Clostridium botulinum D/C]MCD3324968.1 hypothetical protein [Clostridium botulinum D/C]MCD3327746.1 hypothetical protein [Clostridium botulinum D/C]
MLTLKCKSCGFEQVVKKRIDKDTYDQLINNEGLYCDRRCCNGRNAKRPNGYVAIYGVFGGWTIVRQSTMEEYRGIKRAREIRDLGINNR